MFKLTLCARIPAEMAGKRIKLVNPPGNPAFLQTRWFGDDTQLYGREVAHVDFPQFGKREFYTNLQAARDRHRACPGSILVNYRNGRE